MDDMETMNNSTIFYSLNNTLSSLLSYCPFLFKLLLLFLSFFFLSFCVGFLVVFPWCYYVIVSFLFFCDSHGVECSYVNVFIVVGLMIYCYKFLHSLLWVSWYIVISFYIHCCGSLDILLIVLTFLVVGLTIYCY